MIVIKSQHRKLVLGEVFLWACVKPQKEKKKDYSIIVVRLLLYLFMIAKQLEEKKGKPKAEQSDKSCSTIILKEAQKVSEESARKKSAIIRQRNDHKNAKYTALSYPPSPVFGRMINSAQTRQLPAGTLHNGTEAKAMRWIITIM